MNVLGLLLAALVGIQSPQEQPVDLGRPTGLLSGTLLLPAKATDKVPVVLIIAGSGPTDRDGNSRMLPGKNDAYKMLAEALAAQGIASLRYDKQKVGLSSSTLQETDIRFETFVDDAVGWVEKLRADARFSSVIVLGHSEGSLVGILTAQKTQPDGFVSISGVAKRASDVLRDQFRPQFPPDLMAASEAILSALEAGKTPETPVPPALGPIFRTSVQPYLISWFKYLPSEEFAKLKMPTLIIQGTTDIQVNVDEARGLRTAKPDSDLVLVSGMNHVLKIVGDDRSKQMASYSDPTLPIAPEVPRAIVAFMQKLKK